MPPVISKLVQAIGTASSSGGIGVEQTVHSSVSHNENLYRNEVDHFQIQISQHHIQCCLQYHEIKSVC